MDKLSLATLVWRWIKQRGFNLQRINVTLTMKHGMLLCCGPSKKDDYPWSIGVYIEPKAPTTIKISQFREETNDYKFWWVNAADPKCFEKLERHIKKILR
jgi:hypothetical protein